jgi:hypothetical protein
VGYQVEEKRHAHTHTHLQRISASPFVFFFSKTTNNFGLFRIVTFWKMIITFLFFHHFCRAIRATLCA